MCIASTCSIYVYWLRKVVEYSHWIRKYIQFEFHSWVYTRLTSCCKVTNNHVRNFERKRVEKRNGNKKPRINNEHHAWGTHTHFSTDKINVCRIHNMFEHCHSCFQWLKFGYLQIYVTYLSRVRSVCSGSVEEVNLNRYLCFHWGHDSYLRR